MFAVDQARVLRNSGSSRQPIVPTHDVFEQRRHFGRLRPNKVADGIRASAIESDRYDDEAAVFQFLVETLPNWQVMTASSP